jgi:hypothetical protein
MLTVEHDLFQTYSFDIPGVIFLGYVFVDTLYPDALGMTCPWKW